MKDYKIKEKERRKNRIYKVATKTLWQKGYDRTSIRDIAKATDMTTAGLYYYFKSKEDLFQAVIIKEVEILARELEIVINRNTDPVDKLRDYILTKLSTFRSLANFYHAIENDVTAVGFIDEIKIRYEQDEIRMIKRILIEGVRKNEFEIYDFNLAAIGITTAIKGLEMPLSAGVYASINLERSVDIILKIICYGIMKR